MGKYCTINAPAKINLCLRVGKRRSDGYHDLESIVLSLAFGDTLRLEMLDKGAGTPAGDCEILLDAKVPLPCGGLPPEQNLISRAVSLFRSGTSFDRPLRIRLEKRIPLGGGLGGGSSDAASALLALNSLSGFGLSDAALAEMAQFLGSDVPFFLAGGTAHISGRGERIRPIETPADIWVVLVSPGFSSGTAEAYRLLDSFRETDHGKSRFIDHAALSTGESLIADLAKEPSRWHFGNDFLPALMQAGNQDEQDAYRRLMMELQTLGADFSGLTGSGSTCFGIFSHKGAAEQAVNSLSEHWNFVQLTFPLARRADAVLEW